MPTKAEYADLRLRGVCVDCTKRPARPGEVRCGVCAASSAKRAKEWRANNRERSRTAAQHRRESIYWSNPEVFRAEMTERRLAKKVRGVCIDCPAPCLDDNVRCKACKAKHAART